MIVARQFIAWYPFKKRIRPVGDDVSRPVAVVFDLGRLINACYQPGSPLAAYNLQEPWIGMIFGFIGVTDINFVVAEGLANVDRGRTRARIIPSTLA